VVAAVSDSEDDDDADYDSEEMLSDRNHGGGLVTTMYSGMMAGMDQAMLQMEGVQMMGPEEYFTWDLLVKNVTKLPDISLFIQRSSFKNKKYFMHTNEWVYNPPFLVFYRKQQEPVVKE